MSVLTGPKIVQMIGASLGDAYLTEGNLFLRGLQALLQANVISQTATPPGSPNNGDTYVVASGGTGAWSGKDNKIAYWTTQNLSIAAWDFWTPVEGWQVYDQTLNAFYKFDGAAWVASAGAGGSPAGSNLIAIQNPITGASSFTGSATSCLITRIPAGCLQAIGTKIQISITFDATSTGNFILSNSVIRRTLPGDTTFTDTSNLTWSSSVSPTLDTTATKVFTSDSCACTLDTSHDTYIILRVNPSTAGGVLANNFSEVPITKCSGETTGVAYDTVSSIPNLTTLLSALSAQTELISSAIIGA